MSPSRLSILLRHPTRSLFVILILAMLLLRLAWGWHVGRMLQAEWDIVRQRGEPLTVDDLAVTPLPDNRNAWILQVKAANITANSGVDSPASGDDYYPAYPPFGDAWDKAAAASEVAHAEAFALARQARAFPGQTRPAIPKPLLTNVFINLSNARNLANTLGDGALHRHFQGDDAEALERILDTLHLADSLRSEPTFVGQLVAIGIEALAVERIQMMAPTLGDRADAETRQRILNLIQRLNDDRGQPDAVRRAFHGARLFFIREYVETQARGTWMIRPLADQAQMRALRQSHAWVDATGADNIEDARRILQRVTADEQQPAQGGLWATSGPILPRYSRWFDEGAPPHRVFVTIFRQVGDARMTAASLAINLYRTDHGRWPASLDELVPDYLPHVPTDPFHSDGRPIGYVMLKRQDGGDRPMVFVDPGGPDQGPNDPEPTFGWQGTQNVHTGERMHEDARQYRDVSLWLPAERRWDREEAERKAREEAGESEWNGWDSEETVDDDPGEADAPGDQAQPE